VVIGFGLTGERRRFEQRLFGFCNAIFAGLAIDFRGAASLIIRSDV